MRERKYEALGNEKWLKRGGYVAYGRYRRGGRTLKYYNQFFPSGRKIYKDVRLV
jgi:hypothetical protein